MRIEVSKTKRHLNLSFMIDIFNKLFPNAGTLKQIFEILTLLQFSQFTSLTLLSANPQKCSNSLKQFVGFLPLPANLGLVVKGLGHCQNEGIWNHEFFIGYQVTKRSFFNVWQGSKYATVIDIFPIKYNSVYALKSSCYLHLTT